MSSLALACLSGAVWTASWFWSVGLLVLALLISRANWRWWVSVILLAGGLAWRAHSLALPVEQSLAVPRGERVEGILKLGRKVSPGGSRRFGKLRQGERERRVVVMEAGEHRPGEVFAVQGRFFVPGPERNPGVFPRLAQWRRQGVFGGLSVNDADLIEVDSWSAPLRWAEQLRERLSKAITDGLSDDSPGRQVIQAMVLGEKPPRSSEVSRAFRESGAMHVFAVSGLHVTLVGLVCWLFLRPFPVQRRTGLLIVMLVMAGYAMVTGLRPPAIRATVMAVCFFGAFFVRRRPSLFNALSFSLILVLAWRPSQVFEVGFQLSYGVLLAIGLGVGMALKVTGRFAELDPFFPSRLLSDGQRRVWNARKYLANLGASSLAAWVGSVPMMIWHFGVVTPVAVFTSLLLIPATMVILSLAFLAAMLGLIIPWAGVGLNHLNEKVAGASYQIARGFSKVPLGHWQIRSQVPGDWVIFDTDDGGAASFLRAGEGVMIETGSGRFFERELRSILDGWKVVPEIAMVTHPDGDHAGALPALLGGKGLRRSVLPVESALSPSYREFLAHYRQQGCQLAVGRSGEWYDLPEDVKVEIIRGADDGRGGIADNRMMVIKVHWKGWKVLVTGDLGMRGELDLLAAGADLSADVVWMGRHAWGVSGQHQFLEATGAEVVIVSASGVNSLERAPQGWLDHLESEGYQIFHQADTGAVIMNFGEEKLRVSSYLEPGKEALIQR